MGASFYIDYTKCVTVPFQTNKTPYTWDKGTPLVGSNTDTPTYTSESLSGNNIIQHENIIGSAPGLTVTFVNTSTKDINGDYVEYTWNFGDYYNDSTNVAVLTCTGTVQHTYIVPGNYDVTLTQKIVVRPPVAASTLCVSTYDRSWNWDSLTKSTNNGVTWDNTSITKPYVPPVSKTGALAYGPKAWYNDILCFQKYCRAWSWFALSKKSSTPVYWKDTRRGASLQKKWIYEPNTTVCNVPTTRRVSVSSVYISTATKYSDSYSLIQVLPGTKPVAGMSCMTRPLTGITPYTVRLSPSATVCGAFPLDRIEWSFGDGTPNKIVNRFTKFDSDNTIIFTNTFSADPLDVRNYDILHTYTRDINTYPVFYPSLTCYSATTNYYDSCSVTVGPILVPQKPVNAHLVKLRNTNEGNIYAFDIDSAVSINTNTPSNNTQQITQNIPSAPIRDSFGVTQTYKGYTGTRTVSGTIIPDFPPAYKRPLC
jgi:hypothetical protein